MRRLRMRYYFALPVPYRSLFHRYSHKLASPDTLMRLRLIGWIIPAALLFQSPAAAQGVTIPVITSPSPGQIIQGQVAITGTTDILNFASAELDFSYLSDKTNTRFPIQVLTQVIQNSVLTTWDTTVISDGDYLLLLRVYATDGSFQDTSVTVKIRNYSALPLPTPTAIPTEPAIQIPTPILITPSITPTSAPLPTPTLLPNNPAATNVNDVYSDFWRGGLIALLIFSVIGITIRLRRS
jgi:hypothetical protein